MKKMLLPLQGDTTNFIKTQGAALGYKQDALLGRFTSCSVSVKTEAHLRNIKQ